MPVVKKSAKADETRRFPKGKIEIVKMGGHSFSRGTLQRGWKWSTSVKSMVKTDSCQGHHVGYMVAGTLSGVLDNGSKWTIKEGDFYEIPPGHDAWTVGAKSVVLIDYMGLAELAKTKK